MRFAICPRMGRIPAPRRVMRRLITLVIALAMAGLPLQTLAQQQPQHDHQNKQEPATKSDERAPQQMAEPANQQASDGRPAITLAELERMATQNNPTFAQAEAAIRAAEGRRVQAGLYPDPVVGYQGEELAFRAFSKKSEHFFFVEQDIVTAGKLKKSRRIFEHEKTQAMAEADAQKLRVLNAVRMLYYQALGAQEMVATRAELAKIAGEAVKISEELYNIGQADQPDQLEVEIEAQQAELELVNAENERDAVGQQLAAVVGNPSLQPMRLAGELEKGIPAIDREATLAMLLQESPEMKVARANLERARAALDRARAERVPNLYVRGGIGYSTELLELGNGPSNQKTGPEASVEIGVRLPLFNRNQGNIAAAEAELTSAEREVKRVELSLRARMAAAFTGYQNAARLVERYQQTILPRAQKAYNLYLASFNQMAAAYPQVLIAKRSMYQARADYVSALVNLWQNSIRLQGYLLTGGLDAPGMTMRDASTEAGAQGLTGGENDH
ncbi:MAG TPA: TolC family protein [Blastocatellia bacterium]|nr:TolC family protein [Blastocatellia bacterium]